MIQLLVLAVAAINVFLVITLPMIQLITQPGHCTLSNNWATLPRQLDYNLQRQMLSSNKQAVLKKGNAILETKIGVKTVKEITHGVNVQ